MVAVAATDTPDVVTGNVTWVCPAGTATVAGTETAVLLLLSVSVRPPAPAAEDIVTVPVAELPPTTVVGATLTDASAAVTGTAIFTTKPSFPTAFCGCTAPRTGKFD